MLVESLIHDLIARTALTVDDVIDIVGTATDVTIEIADEYDPERAAQSTILDDIATSLWHDRESN